MFRGPFFRGRDKILLLGEALTFGGNFSKICLKIIKTIKGLEKIAEKSERFARKISFF